MAQNSGFFNALKNGDVYDRTYNADDYSDCLRVIISNGVLMSDNDDLKVTASGLTVSIGIGFAMINGKYYNNDTGVAFTVPTAHQSLPRIDRVVLRYNNNVSARNIALAYIQGTAAENPTAPNLTREGEIYDLCLANINVPAQATSVTVEDKRSDSTVCGWLYSIVGDGSFFTSYANEFYSFLNGVKDTLASVTMYKKYAERITTTSEVTQVTIGIPQYDPTGVDVVDVVVNGMLESPGKDYTLSGNVITFTDGVKSAGTKIDIYVSKSIDGTGLGTVSDEITALQDQVDTLGDVSDYNYICTGLNDNIALSQLAESFLTAADDGKVLTLYIYGNIGIGAPYAGAGTSSNRYKYFEVGLSGATSRRVIFDFENCSAINITCTAGTHNIVFYGWNANIRNANVKVTSTDSNSSCVIFSSTQGEITADDCQFSIDGYANCKIAQNGTFNRCYGYIINTNDSFCFDVSTNGLLRVNGGEYYAYAKSSSAVGAVVNIAEAATQAAAVLNGMNCPTVALSGATQTYAVRQLAGHAMCYGTITGLTVSVLGTSLNSGMINRSKPGRL